ncbi:MAG: Re/Si-specific NAD(P)(+) transhydrogenase subunit alpha [Deltaproteobacteria bacterium]|nr:Re/Si-specific NAD(P)(+) transhydrogenase subunit alpha [Deltaproteobacteria bacterium]
MPVGVGVLKEIQSGENRVALVPEVVAKLVQAGYEVRVEKGAGLSAYFPDELYEKAGAKIEADKRALLSRVDILLKVQPPLEAEIELIPEGKILIGLFFAHRDPERLAQLKNKKVQCFAMEFMPRITRAQVMDVLSSQSTVAGYKAVLLAAGASPKFFPMLTTAAGTIRPAKVLILGAGVAGLQAIATARRLGAIVSAHDIRASVKEQVESLGAKFVGGTVNAETQGGYARELTEEEKNKEKEVFAKHVAEADIVITTAQVPGRSAPRLITKAMIDGMKSGSVVVDIAAESGGNCELTKAGEIVESHGVKIVGLTNLPSLLPAHASEMYAKNLLQFLNLLTQNGKTLTADLKDEIIQGVKL